MYQQHYLEEKTSLCPICRLPAAVHKDPEQIQELNYTCNIDKLVAN
jgi:hypothetical protein